MLQLINLFRFFMSVFMLCRPGWSFEEFLKACVDAMLVTNESGRTHTHTHTHTPHVFSAHNTLSILHLTVESTND